MSAMERRKTPCRHSKQPSRHGYGIETDVQLSSDGEAMVFHDHTLDRLTNQTGPVSDFTAAELGRIAYANGTGTIPTLGELLDVVAGRTGLIIEIKSGWSGDTRLVQRTVQCLAGYAGPVAVMSFDPVQVAWLAQHAPGIVRGMVADGAPQHEYGFLPLVCASFIAGTSPRGCDATGFPVPGQALAAQPGCAQHTETDTRR